MISTTETLEPAPEDGAVGPRGQKVYPSGKYDPNIEYTCTEYVAPYVLDGSMYFAMNKVGTSKGIDPSDDYAANGDNATWIPFDMFKYILTEVLFANFGKLASAIFLGDYMFSQKGKTGSGQDTTSYQNFNGDLSASSNFIPKILMNFLTGFSQFENIKLIGDIDATNARFYGALSSPFKDLTEDDVIWDSGSIGHINLNFNSGFNWAYAASIYNVITLNYPTDLKYDGVFSDIFNKPILTKSGDYLHLSGDFIYKKMNLFTTNVSKINLSSNAMACLRGITVNGSLYWYVINSDEFSLSGTTLNSI